MGTTAWIAAGLAAGLLANMRVSGKRSRGLILLSRPHSFFSFPGRLAAIAELGSFLAGEKAAAAAASTHPLPVTDRIPPPAAVPNGSAAS